MSTPFPAPHYALDEQVRYRPRQPEPDWPTAWHPEPWRIVGRTCTEFLGATPAVRYVIQPAMLSGHWRGHDQPLVVGEDQLRPWRELPAICDTREELSLSNSVYR